MPSDAQTLTTWLTHRLDTYLEELHQLCAVDCPTDYKPGVDAVGAWTRRWCQARGWEIQEWPDQLVGDSFVASLRGSGKGRVMLVAHLDTVYPVGVVAERPLRRAGERLIGPATADNKSGLLSGLYAAAALEALGRLRFERISIVCGGDEETDARSSGALLRSLAPEHDIALVLEAGRENGDIVGARKGSGTCELTVHGRSAHAGVEPEKGRHAILALAHQTVALQALNGMRPGVTVNVGVVQGGSVPNAVPDRARALVDVRVSDPEDMASLEAAIRAIAATPYVSGTTTEIGDGWHYPPMGRTPAIATLADLAAQCAQELGFSVKDAATGGVSYANLLAGAGLPVLDGLGPVGGLDHSPSEYIDIPSIVPRTALLALLMLRWAEGR